MVSRGFSRWATRLMPYRAILESDLLGMTRSWVVRIWLVLMAFQVFLTITQAFEEDVAAEALANLLGTFPLIWSLFVIIISSGAVSSEAGVVADSVLSKAVTRYEYILAKISARLIAVIGIYLVVVLPPALIIARNTEGQLSSAGIAWAVLIIGMFLALLTNLAVMFSTLFNRTLVAVVVVWFIWYGAGLMLSLVGGDYLSPIYIIDNLPALLSGTYDMNPARTVIGFGVPSVGAALLAVWYFSRKDL